METIKKRKVLTLSFIMEGNRILLGRKKRGFGAGRWNGFGGKVEAGETIRDGAIREIREECGLNAISLEEIGEIEFTFEKMEELLEVHVFVVGDYSGEVVESEEMAPKWFEKQEIPFQEMWSDDPYWFPIMLQRGKFKAKFHFDANDRVLEHDVKTL